MSYLQLSKWLVIGLILVAAFVILPLVYSKWRKAEQKAAEVATYAKTQSDSVSHYRNKLGEEVASKQAVILNYRSLETLSQDRHLGYLKEFEGLKSSLNNLAATSTVTGQVAVPIQANLRDTVIQGSPAFSFNTGDEWYQAKGTVVPPKVSMDIKVTVPVKTAVFWRRKKFLGLRIGKKVFRAEALSPNPYVKITQLEQIVIQRD